jgi:heptosyltransferase-2
VAELFDTILVIQTAFIGDAILTLPLLQALHHQYPKASIDAVVIPRTAEIFANHPAISHIIQYDKRGHDKGLKGLWRLRSKLIVRNYDLVIVPHRSLRSALLMWLLKPVMSIGFDRSAGHRLFKQTVRYDPSAHEIERNLSLLNPLHLPGIAAELPLLYPSNQDVHVVDSIMNSSGLNRYPTIIAIAPGTVWNTKRWPPDRFASVGRQIASESIALVLIGGREDEALCKEIMDAMQVKNIFNVAGKLSLLQSAEMIRRCKVLISNDSAPMHIAVSMRTPVIAIFGATVPAFGFAPRGQSDIVLETKGLPCRPCSIHGGKQCPIKTFDCMLSITPEMVIDKLKLFINQKNV